MVEPGFLTLADDPALDFLNTVVVGEGGLNDLLETDGDVLAWLRLMSFLGEKEQPTFPRDALLQAAHTLRDVIRKLVIQKKNGKRVDIGALNSFLVHGRYKVTLVRGVEGTLEIAHEYEKSTPEQLLIEVAQAAAELLAEGNFDLVRKCESPDCVLWFYDKTKSHKRRWCSMALCGNRHKVANFRARQKQSEA